MSMIVVRALALIAGLVLTAGRASTRAGLPRPPGHDRSADRSGRRHGDGRAPAGAEAGTAVGKPFVIENRPGAGTNIGAAAVARSAPDGYTLLMATSSTMAINSSIYKSLPFDPLKDLMPVVLYARVPFVLVVNPSSPAQTAGRPRQARQGKARHVELRHLGHRNGVAPVRRVVQDANRRRGHARALQEHGAAAERRAGRSSQLHVQRSVARACRSFATASSVRSA
jgi:hypothetical protein